MTDWINLSDIIALYADMLQIALPIIFFFGMCNILFDMITGAAFNGIMRIGGRGR